MKLNEARAKQLAILFASGVIVLYLISYLWAGFKFPTSTAFLNIFMGAGIFSCLFLLIFNNNR